MTRPLIGYGAGLPRDLYRLLRGAAAYRRTGLTPPDSYQSFVRLFCLTGGMSNRLVSHLTRSPPVPAIEPGTSVFTGADEASALAAAQALSSDGYVVLKGLLSAELCDRLLAFGLAARMRLRGSAGERRYDRAAPEGVRYDLEPEEVINRPEVQRLLADGLLLRIAQLYLEATPIADVTSMWWHTAFSKVPDSDAAQFYHFDLDRPRWLKVFCYLTDVGPENGPHCFVRGSHRDGGIPWRLRSKGYVRLGDEEVDAAFDSNRLVRFVAPCGTVILEDTRGLHKGLHVLSGDRLMLQLQFSDSLFGGTYPAASFRRPASPQLEARIDELPSVYSNYLGGT